MNFRIGTDILKNDKPKQYPKDEILNEDDRLARSWFSIEVRDKQGDIVPIDELKRVMNVWMRRGAPMSDQHTNRVIGKGLNWQVKEHPETKMEGVLIDYQIFKDYSIDDQVWDDIKSGRRKGLSLGGRATKKAVMKDDEWTGMPGKYLKGLELYEIAPVDEPANQFAYNTDINYLAKGSESFLNLLINDLRKDYEGFNSFEECYNAQLERGHDENAAKRIAAWMTGQEEMKMKKVKDTEEECEEGIVYDGDVEKKVKKIGEKWHVVHCHKSEVGKPIESSPGYPTRERAMEQHRAIMVENKEEGRPGKEWFDNTVESLRREHDVKDPEALANWIWQEKKGMTDTKSTEDNIPGGLSEGSDVSSFDQEQLSEGVKVEMEHTNDEKIAREIASDHLSEDPDYYKKLKTIEVKGSDVSVKPVIKKSNLLKALLQPVKKSNLIKELKKVRHYVKPGETPPEGANVQQGEKGGYYYEDRPQAPSQEKQPFRGLGTREQGIQPLKRPEQRLPGQETKPMQKPEQAQEAFGNNPAVSDTRRSQMRVSQPQKPQQKPQGIIPPEYPKEKPKESFIKTLDGKMTTVGEKVKVNSRLTTDPYNKRGQTGEIKAIGSGDTDGAIVLQFEDGSIGIYMGDAVESTPPTQLPPRKPVTQQPSPIERLS